MKPGSRTSEVPPVDRPFEVVPRLAATASWAAAWRPLRPFSGRPPEGDDGKNGRRRINGNYKKTLPAILYYEIDS